MQEINNQYVYCCYFFQFSFFFGGLLPFHWLPLTSSARFSSSPRLIRVSFAYAKRFMPHLHTLVLLLYNQGLLLFRRGPRRRTPIKRELATLLLVVSVFETLICICKATGSVFLLVLFFLDKMADWGPSFAQPFHRSLRVRCQVICSIIQMRVELVTSREQPHRIGSTVSLGSSFEARESKTQ